MGFILACSCAYISYALLNRTPWQHFLLFLYMLPPFCPTNSSSFPSMPCVCVCTCISVCIDVYICMHLNIDPEEVHAVFEIFCDVPRTAEDKVEKYLVLGLALAALVMSPGFLCGFNHCELFVPCSHLLNSCCRGDGIRTERNPPVNTGSLGAVLPPFQTSKESATSPEAAP